MLNMDTLEFLRATRFTQYTRLDPRFELETARKRRNTNLLGESIDNAWASAAAGTYLPEAHAVRGFRN